jgi:hypothetical protein
LTSQPAAAALARSAAGSAVASEQHATQNWNTGATAAPKSHKVAISDILSVGEGVMKITALIFVLLALAMATGTAVVASVHKEQVCSPRGGELLIRRPAHVFVGAAVFTLGVLAAAGFAAWMMPPV